MTNQFRAAPTCLLVLLTVITSPAHAITVPDAIEAVDVTFANGFTLTGEMSFNYGFPGCCGYDYPTPGPAGLYLNGQAYFEALGEPNGETLDALFFTPPSSTNYTAEMYVNFADLPNNLTYSDFTLSTSGSSGSPPYLNPPLYAGVSGTVSCVSGCGVYATPLPNALPMFCIALFGLVGLATRRIRETLNDGISIPSAGPVGIREAQV